MKLKPNENDRKLAEKIVCDICEIRKIVSEKVEATVAQILANQRGEWIEKIRHCFNNDNTGACSEFDSGLKQAIIVIRGENQ